MSDAASNPKVWEKNQFKNCIVWTYIPVLTTIFPIIGHVGVGNSRGVTYDFAGSNFVSEDEMAFNPPYKVYKLGIDSLEFNYNWDMAIRETVNDFSLQSHNLLTNNCHHFVASVLNRSKFGNKTEWNAISVFIMSYKAKYLGYKEIFKTWAPFITLITILLITITTVFSCLK